MPSSVQRAPAPLASATLAPWLPDQGDGTYRNPVLFADYSDPDAIRVGDDFWLTASSFCHVPGLPILHSRDLVNWRLVNHALPRLTPEEHFAAPRHGGGVWAPSIRFHAGRFWIFYPDPDFGLYVVTAEDPRQAWSAPQLIKAGKGLIDPCPFWDDDGTAYLVHGWAKSRSGVKNRITLHRLRPDALAICDAGKVIIDGDSMPGWHTIEGPKLYRRGHYYYLFAPAGGVADGYQAVFRSRCIEGPYESRIVLAQGSTEVNGPHQGAWVDTPSGTDWFLHFQERPAYGRVVHLQPMEWRDDWPVIGVDADRDGTGEPVSGARKPVPSDETPTAPPTSDEFAAAALAPQWQWQANPRREWLTLDARPGWLRLTCVPHKPKTTLWTAPNLLLQKFPAPEFQVTARLEFSLAADGDTAGIVVFGFSYAWLGLRREHGRIHVVFHTCLAAHSGGHEHGVVLHAAPSNGVLLRVEVTAGARCQFAYSLDDGRTFVPVEEKFHARSSYWVGAKVGLFACSGELHPERTGHADFDWFRVTVPG